MSGCIKDAACACNSDVTLHALAFVSLYCGHMNFVYNDNYYNGTGRGQKLKAIITATTTRHG